MAGAYGVDARALQDLELPLGGRPVDRHAQRAQIGMIANTLDFDVPPVQQEAFLRVEGDGADAEWRGVAVHHAAAIHDFAHQRVQVGVVDIPPLGLGHAQAAGDGQAAASGDNRRTAGLRHLPVARIEDRTAERHVGLLIRAVEQLSLHRHAALYRGHLGCGDVGTPQPHAHRAGDIEPHVAIDSRAGIPARRMVLGREPHSQHILAGAEAKVRSEVEREADIAVRPASQFLPVQPHPRVGHSAIEQHAEIAPAPAFGDGEMLAIPARPVDRQRAGMRVLLRIERPVDRPIVRQTDGDPPRIVEIRLLGTVGRALQEPPIIVETDAALGNRYRVSGGRRPRQQRKKQNN